MSSTQNINSQFFNGVYKDVWKGINPAGLTTAEIDFIVEIGSLDENSSVLDLMCGYGRHAIGLAQKNIQVVAVDNLESYITEIKGAAENQNLPLHAVLSDVISFNPSRDFDAVICMGNSFAFFDKTDSIQLLRKIASCLKPDGVFILNSWMIAEIAIRHFREKDWFYVGEYKYLLDYKFCFAPNRIESEQTIISPDGSIETNKGVDYIFTLDELEAMLKSVELTIRNMYSTPRKKRFSLGDPSIYLVIEKINPS